MRCNTTSIDSGNRLESLRTEIAFDNVRQPHRARRVYLPVGRHSPSTEILSMRTCSAAARLTLSAFGFMSSMLLDMVVGEVSVGERRQRRVLENACKVRIIILQYR